MAAPLEAWPPVGVMAVSVPLHASNIKCEVREVMNICASGVEGQKRDIPYATFAAIANSVLSLVDKVLNQSTPKSLEDAIGRVEKTSQMILDKLERSVQPEIVDTDVKITEKRRRLNPNAVVNDIELNAISKAGKVVQIKSKPGLLSGELVHQLILENRAEVEGEVST